MRLDTQNNIKLKTLLLKYYKLYSTNYYNLVILIGNLIDLDWRSDRFNKKYKSDHYN